MLKVCFPLIIIQSRFLNATCHLSRTHIHTYIHTYESLIIIFVHTCVNFVNVKEMYIKNIYLLYLFLNFINILYNLLFSHHFVMIILGCGGWRQTWQYNLFYDAIFINMILFFFFVNFGKFFCWGSEFYNFLIWRKNYKIYIRMPVVFVIEAN